MAIESQIRALFDETRAQNVGYSSAGYPEQGERGLGNRLAALEQAVLQVARAIDELAAEHEGANRDSQ